MKTSAVLFFLGLALPAFAQELEPSPTESIGCEPHGDHWHCEGPRPTADATTEVEVDVPETTPAVMEPSPTESIGCEPHGDHWHCEGPRPTDGGSDETSTPVDTLTTITTTTSGVASGIESATTTATSSIVTAGAAGGPMMGAVPVVGLAALAALGF